MRRWTVCDGTVRRGFPWGEGALYFFTVIHEGVMEEARAAPHGGCVAQPRLRPHANVCDVGSHTPEEQHARQQLLGEAAASLRRLRSEERTAPHHPRNDHLAGGERSWGGRFRSETDGQTALHGGGLCAPVLPLLATGA